MATIYILWHTNPLALMIALLDKIKLKSSDMTLITIISRDLHELVPIIFEFIDRTTKHILIYDDKEKHYALKIQRWIVSLAQEVELIEVDEDSKADMLSIQNHINGIDTTELYLNATNADTALLVVLSGSILHNGGKIVAYDKFENSYNLIDESGFGSHTITHNMMVDDFVLSLGYQLTNEIDKAKILSKKKSLLLLFGDFNILFRIRRYLHQNRLQAIASAYPGQIEALIDLGMIGSDYRALRNISYFGTLFEEFTYLSLLCYDFDDIKVGAVLLFDSAEDDPYDIEIFNEFDILAIKENHIYTIECKLGDNISAQDIIYKSDSLLGYFGDDSKNMIINIYPDNSHKIQKPKTLFGKNAKLRAITNSIEIYNAHTFGTKKFHKKISPFFQLKKRVFLLGGYDLEMRTIKKLLDRYAQVYYDHSLSWGAKLGSYSDRLKNNYLYIGIELIEDIELPANYLTIDHHNEKQKNKSSLEQVADTLGVQLSRQEMLIALNDSGYIPAMREFGASQNEIDEIRKKDRKAQGVTKKDEQLAIESIKMQKKEGNTTVVKAFTDKFSPIADRLYGKNILIYNDSKLNYYGDGIEKIVTMFRHIVEEQKAYYGGGFGFFGFDEHSFSKSEILEFRDEILKMQKK
ncbi:MAG: hypothetical protein U9R27_06260 [Campylobacterota bacterium]|nr:hypothetical protein [Campylobacterota bacterium]